MAQFSSRTTFFEEQLNPFEAVDNTETLRNSLNEIDNRDIRCKFKATEDPIQYVFESFTNTPLKTLAKDFVKEGITDLVSFVAKICK
ncbi:MAG: hypothetical protein IKL52_01535 [Candidatus Gastranaerophilales bacterium]|nr:hypothetical protein [Candidatus Gastranaerophilales bacterium]